MKRIVDLIIRSTGDDDGWLPLIRVIEHTGGEKIIYTGNKHPTPNEAAAEMMTALRARPI